MPRPSQQVDLALLASGRELFPSMGCAGLSLRRVAEHAGVNAGMFHYHFKTKDNFLRTLLQQEYEAMFATLAGAAGQDGPTLVRLREALVVAARFLREHRRLFARLLMDVIGGEPVAVEFMQRNGPRHLGLLMGLLEQAQREGLLRAMPPVQRFVMLMGSIAMPVVLAPGIVESGIGGAPFQAAFDAQVMSDEGIAQRVDLLIELLRSEGGSR